MSDGRTLTTAVMLAIFAGMSALALGFPAKAGFAPLLVGIPASLLCLAQLVIDLRRKRSSRAAGPGSPETGEENGEIVITPREWFMFVWLAVFAALIAGTGFHVGGPVAVFLYVRFGERERWFNAIFAGLGTFAIMWLVFTELLELSLFDGLLLSALLG
jgi:hypothetical protein